MWSASQLLPDFNDDPSRILKMWWARGDILGTFIHYTHSLDCQRSNSAIFLCPLGQLTPHPWQTADCPSPFSNVRSRGGIRHQACQGWVVQQWASQSGPGGENISHNVRAAGNSTPKSFLSSPRDSFLIESRCQGSGKKGNKARHYTKVSPEYHDWICVKNKSQG